MKSWRDWFKARPKAFLLEDFLLRKGKPVRLGRNHILVGKCNMQDAFAIRSSILDGKRLVHLVSLDDADETATHLGMTADAVEMNIPPEPMLPRHAMIPSRLFGHPVYVVRSDDDTLSAYVVFPDEETVDTIVRQNRVLLLTHQPESADS